MLEKKHHAYREEIRDFCLKQIEPKAKILDEEQRFLSEHIKPLADKGLFSVFIPEEYGGKPVDTISYAIAVEELSRVCGSTGITVAAHNSLGTFPILEFGTELQKKKYLPKGANGELIAFGLSEPDAGSDAGGTRTFAKKIDNGWEVNGSKCWITSATTAFATIGTARTSDDPKDRHITTFIMDKDAKGYSVGKKENKIGLRGSDTAFLHFDEMFVPDENILGKEGEGFKQMLITLDGGRISIGAMALGLGQGALDVALKYAADRKQFGKPIIRNQAIQHKLADMSMELEAARLLIYDCARRKDAHEKYTRYSATCKLYASEVGRRCAEHAIQILGSVGILTGKYTAERIWRDVKLCEIGEGTSEVQRLVIARELLNELK